MTKTGRNDPCHCGSGKKYKQCCLAKEQKPIKRNTIAATGSKRYYSSHGEDYILSSIFINRFYGMNLLDGFYVDVGAHHPTLLSNTAFFYNLGWRGINIEANPGALKAFKRERPRDININCAISSTDGEIDFHLFGNEDQEVFGSSSTISNSHKDYIETGQNVKAKTIKVKCSRLDTIMEQHCENIEIDFMSMDIEGAELEALKSNDFNKYRPLIIAIEILPHKISADKILENDPIVKFLTDQGYNFFSLALKTYFFYDTLSKRKDIIERWGIR